MPQLYVLRESTVRQLRAELDSNSERLKLYAPGGEPVEFKPEKDLLRSPITTEAEPPVLLAGDSASESDANNAVLVHRYLPDLTPMMAADERLWAALTHREFWTYCSARWPKASKRQYVVEHWFLAGRGLAALRRNAISRLWWAAHLTCAPWEADPDLKFLQKADRYFYTRVLLASQQVSFDILERSYGSDHRLRTCFLDALNQCFERGVTKDPLVRAAAKKPAHFQPSRQAGS